MNRSAAIVTHARGLMAHGLELDDAIARACERTAVAPASRETARRILAAWAARSPQPQESPT